MSPLILKKSKEAFSLVEVTMAIGVMSFCLVAMLGMLPVGLSQERKANDQLLALQALTAVATEFKAAPLGTTKTKLYEIKIPAVGQAAEVSALALDENLKKIEGSTGKKFDVSYQIEPPSSTFASYRLSLRVYKTARTNPSADASTDYVESVILKPAF
jgi:uncharacterized protein (TIGR02598 family)